jgi:hypothetical protein
MVVLVPFSVGASLWCSDDNLHGRVRCGEGGSVR